MTNPPYILAHLNEIAEILHHPCVYSFLHVHVQFGSNVVFTVSDNIIRQIYYKFVTVDLGDF